MVGLTDAPINSANAKFAWFAKARGRARMKNIR